MSHQPHHNVHPHEPPHFQRRHHAPPPPPPQPNYGPVVVQERDSGRSIEGVTVPILLVFTFAMFLIGATWLASTQLNSLQNSVERLGVKIEDVASRIKERLDRLETSNEDNLSKKDHQLWCASAERANRNIGWACMEHPTQPEPQPTVKGWRATLK